MAIYCHERPAGRGMTAHDANPLIAASPAPDPQANVDWHHGLDALRRYVAARGSAVMPPAARADGVAVGAWAAARREEYWNGRLDPQRAKLLEALPGWDWSGRHQRRWFTVFAALTRFVAKHPVSEIEPRLVFDRVRLGSWVEVQRAAYSAGTLPRPNADLLAAIPGWEWPLHRSRTSTRSSIVKDSAATRRATLLEAPASKLDALTMQRGLIHSSEQLTADDDQWYGGYSVLCSYVKHAGDAKAPKNATFERFAIGAWVAENRRRYRRGELAIDRIEALERLPGWIWGVTDAAWQQSFETLLRYRDAHGTASPAASVVFDGLRLGFWVSTQRVQYRRGRLARTRRQRLEAVPGWTWSPGRAATRHREMGTGTADRVG